LRDKHGTITKPDVQGAVFYTAFTSINPSGAITGYFFDANSLGRGFVRAKDGTITTFDVPGVGAPYFGDGTIPQSINPNGEITGYYTDAHGTYHGFLRNPDHQAESKNELDDQGGKGSDSPE
jgi:hypothetical protein